MSAKLVRHFSGKLEESLVKNKVGLGFTYCTVHRRAGLIDIISSLSRILGLLLVWDGTVLGLLISLPNQGWKVNRRSIAC